MNKRTIVFAAIGGLLALAVLGVFLDPTRTALGYLRGEKFYQNRPTSYWRKVILSDNRSPLASPEAVPVLVEALKDRNANVRSSAASLLGQIGPAARDAVPALNEAIRDAKGNLDAETLDYLRKVEEMKLKHPGLDVEVEFDTPETATRYAAAEALKKIDPAAARKAGLP